MKDNLKPLTYKTNIVKMGETIRGEGMYNLLDQNGKVIPFIKGMDYELATFYIDWINEGNTKPYMMNEILNHLKNQ